MHIFADCGQSTFSNESGNITSPNYPLSYENNQFCNYFVVAQPLSTINFSFNALSLEQQTICSFDWIEAGSSSPTRIIYILYLRSFCKLTNRSM